MRASTRIFFLTSCLSVCLSLCVLSMSVFFIENSIFFRNPENHWPLSLQKCVVVVAVLPPHTRHPPLSRLHVALFLKAPSLRSPRTLCLRKCLRQHFHPDGLFLDSQTSLHIHNTCYSWWHQVWKKTKAHPPLNYLLFVASTFLLESISKLGHSYFILNSSPLYVLAGWHGCYLLQHRQVLQAVWGTWICELTQCLCGVQVCCLQPES